MRRDVCWHCGGQLVWQNDWGYDEWFGDDTDEDRMVTVLKCADCGCEVWYITPPKEEKE